ncbi:hypothetical protein LK536_03235 [Lachnoclostridium pacaense]|uniref:hypothetical protein n=1 Tax=Enterocloster hominis (ex Hitch et al. 2024) TaxID=1917870 RepID=UPI001D117C64|nr:hypothetical protein [Lachnoclostridium pacaense]MCC2875281.1 hypothetical protein [Lachnoclostridium pacaense]
MREWIKIHFRQRLGESGESCREILQEKLFRKNVPGNVVGKLFRKIVPGNVVRKLFRKIVPGNDAGKLFQKIVPGNVAGKLYQKNVPGNDTGKSFWKMCQEITPGNQKKEGNHLWTQK